MKFVYYRLISFFLLLILIVIFLLIVLIPDILPTGTDITFAYIANIGAIATVLVAIAAFETIIAADNREQRRAYIETKNKTLQEIIDFCLEIINIGIEASKIKELHDIGSSYKHKLIEKGVKNALVTRLFEEEMDASYINRYKETEYGFGTLFRKGERLQNRAKSIDNDLFEEIKRLRMQIKSHIKILQLAATDIKNDKLKKGMNKHRRFIGRIANSVIEIASK